MGQVSIYTVTVFVDAELIRISSQQNGTEPDRHVEGLRKFIDTVKDLRMGWGSTDDFDIIFVYDKGDDGWGYAVNIQCPEFSEWGYAPFEEGVSF